MTNALIGHTGFVGSTLLRSESFDALYNSSSIEQIRGRRHDRIVCAGVSAVKWWANRNPEEDMRRIQILIDCLSEVECGHFTLISTVDVYGRPIGQTEADSPMIPDLHAYGANRLVLERFVADRFGRHSIIRLPGLFGIGLKKNVIFDMMTHNQPEAINPQSRLQWYPVAHLSRDIAAIETSGIALVNVVTEPLSTGAIHDRFFPDLAIGSAAAGVATYDNYTLYPELLGGTGHYHMSAEQVLAALQTYLDAPHG